jgi:hypothetical protein
MQHKSPEDVLLHHARQLIANSSYSQAKFIHDLLLPALIDAGLEKPEDHRTADEYESWRSAKVRQMNSIINGHTNLPLRWLWVWLDVLPEPYGAAARKEVLAQGGALSVDLSCLEGRTTNRSDLPRLFREVADVMEAGADVAADGKYDHKDDCEELQALGNELTDVIELCVAELLAVNQATDLSGTRAGVIVKMFKSTK